MAAAPSIFLRPDPMDVAAPPGTWLLGADRPGGGLACERFSFTQAVILAILLSVLPWCAIVLMAWSVLT
jgi:hypothetical protein